MTERESVKYRRGLEGDDRSSNAAASNDSAGPLKEQPGGLGRRGFLQAAGFSFAAAALGACQRAPVEKAIPFLVPPEEIVPGRALYYASTCRGCSAGCGILVKTRDGRPVKLEGNPTHPISRGALCCVGQASILGLYDSSRLRQPLRQGQPASWADLDGELVRQLATLRENGGRLRLLTGTVNSPTARAVVTRFLAGFPDARHISYDALSVSAIPDAHLQTHGVRVLPRYHFDQSDVIVSLDADFLGTWISPVEFTGGYSRARTLEDGTPVSGYHLQVESRLSLTGTKADQRLVLRPSQIAAAARQLSAEVAILAGHVVPAAAGPLPRKTAAAAARRLWGARKRSLVISGSQDLTAQVACNRINHLLGNYGETIDLQLPSRQKLGDDSALESLLDEISQGQVDALLVWGVNPVFELPLSPEQMEALTRIPLLVSFDERLTETSRRAGYVCPEPHFLESWGDQEAVSGSAGLLQPSLAPLGATRSVIETLSTWMGDSRSAYQLLREHWRSEMFPRQTQEQSFERFWQKTLHDGYVQLESPAVSTVISEFVPGDSDSGVAEPGAHQFELVLYPKPGLLEGRHAYNPWLLELPDPITKVAWDNYACLSPRSARELGLSQGDLVEISSSQSGNLELPVVIQPGQHDRVVAVALGYGAQASQRFSGIGPEWLEGRPTVDVSGLVGQNAAPFLRFDSGRLTYAGAGIGLRALGRRRTLASTQLHNEIEVPPELALPGARVRPAIQEMSWDEYSGHSSTAHEVGAHEELGDLWPADHVYPDHHWAMMIDLDACTGCSACVVACQVENNIPVVGKDEVRRQREMYWLRIDRYYSGAEDAVKVVHQPMLCQQCDNAPCETVCPVLATVHSHEGLNQQIYNRCVGTRYCANNCPYKVRRFNWFEYSKAEQLENLVLNPDVTVRSRGVMEKCSFCIQRIQEARMEARRQGEELLGDDIQTACQQTCPAGAIVFGDSNQTKGRLTHLAQSKRHYKVLEELNVKPSVGYLKVVRRENVEDG